MELDDFASICRASLFLCSTAGSDVSHLVYQRMLEDQMGLTRGLYLIFVPVLLIITSCTVGVLGLLNEYKGMSLFMNSIHLQFLQRGYMVLFKRLLTIHRSCQLHSRIA